MALSSTELPVTRDRALSAFDYGLLGLGSLLWGGGVIGSKLVAMGFPALAAAGMRTAIASLVFVPLILIADRRLPKLTRGDFLTFLALGASGYAGYTGLYFIAMKFTTASHGALMNGSVPIITAILSAILIGERLGAIKTVGVVITTLGVACIVVTSATGLAGEATVLGDLIMLAATTSWSLYTIYTRPLMRRYSPTTVTGLSCLFGTAMLLPLALLTDFSLPAIQTASTGSWLALAYVALGSMVIAYVIWSYGVKKIGATRAAVFSNIAPVWGVLLSVPIMGETLSIYHFLAAILVLGGVWLTNKG